MRGILVLTTFLVASAALATAIPTAYCQDNELSNQLIELLSSPIAITIFLTQLGLGFGLGYFSMKAVKYVVALICIFALGILLNIWQFGGIEGLARALGLPNISELTAMLQTVVSILGILTILPIGAGFFIGAIIAARK
jgi:uncharacterized membrane protein (Fun14 family)